LRLPRVSGASRVEIAPILRAFRAQRCFQARLVHTGQHLRRPPIARYLEFLKLMSEARVVLTDSGGMQEETTVLGVPCVTLRDSTERRSPSTRGRTGSPARTARSSRTGSRRRWPRPCRRVRPPPASGTATPPSGSSITSPASSASRSHEPLEQAPRILLDDDLGPRLGLDEAVADRAVEEREQVVVVAADVEQAERLG